MPPTDHMQKSLISVQLPENHKQMTS